VRRVGVGAVDRVSDLRRELCRPRSRCHAHHHLIERVGLRIEGLEFRVQGSGAGFAREFGRVEGLDFSGSDLEFDV